MHTNNLVCKGKLDENNEIFMRHCQLYVLAKMIVFGIS